MSFILNFSIPFILGSLVIHTALDIALHTTNFLVLAIAIMIIEWGVIVALVYPVTFIYVWRERSVKTAGAT